MYFHFPIRSTYLPHLNLINVFSWIYASELSRNMWVATQNMRNLSTISGNVGWFSFPYKMICLQWKSLLPYSALSIIPVNMSSLKCEICSFQEGGGVSTKLTLFISLGFCDVFFFAMVQKLSISGCCDPSPQWIYTCHSRKKKHHASCPRTWLKGKNLFSWISFMLAEKQQLALTERFCQIASSRTVTNVRQKDYDKAPVIDEASKRNCWSLRRTSRNANHTKYQQVNSLVGRAAWHGQLVSCHRWTKHRNFAYTFAREADPCSTGELFLRTTNLPENENADQYVAASLQLSVVTNILSFAVSVAVGYLSLAMHIEKREDPTGYFEGLKTRKISLSWKDGSIICRNIARSNQACSSLLKGSEVALHGSA